MLYKINLEFDKIDLNVCFAKFKQYGYEIYSCLDEVYLHIDILQDNKQVPIADIMKEANIQHYVIRVLSQREDIEELPSFAKAWCYEKFYEDERKEFEQQHQVELKQMIENISQVQKMLEDARQTNNNIRESQS